MSIVPFVRVEVDANQYHSELSARLLADVPDLPSDHLMPDHFFALGILQPGTQIVSGRVQMLPSRRLLFLGGYEYLGVAMSLSLSASPTATHGGAIPTGTISALIGQPPNTTNDYYIARYLLMAFHLKTDPALGVVIAPVRPVDYVNETRETKIMVSMSIAMVVMIVITGLRLSVRAFRTQLMVGWDDVVIIPGVLLAIAWPAMQMCAAIYGGAGKHMYDVTYEEYGHFKTFTNLCKPIFFVSVGLIKVSICLFNQRLTAMTSRTWKIINWSFLGLLIVYTFLALFWTLFQCNPPYAGWDPVRIGKEGQQFKCTPDTIVGSALSSIHVIMDFGLLSVPLIVLWNIRMGWGTKLRLYFVFSIGAMSFIGSVVRQIEQDKLKTDVLWNFVHVQDWTLIDLTFGVVAASLPILSTFIPSSWKSVRGTNDPSNSHYGPSGRTNKQSLTFGGHSRSRPDPDTISLSSNPGTENILRTDVIELKFQSKSQYLKGDRDKGSESGSNDSDLEARAHQDREYTGDETFPKSDHRTWVGRDSDWQREL